MTALDCTPGNPFVPLPPAFDPRGLCPTLARVAFIAWREERTRQGAAWEKQIRELSKRFGRAVS